MKVAASPRKKEANPASLRSAAPSKGRGSRGHFLLPMEGGAPKGRRLDGGSGMKKSGKIVSSTPFTRAALSPYRQSKYTHMWKKNNDGQSLPLEGKVASEVSRIEH